MSKKSSMFEFWETCETKMIPDISDELIEKMAEQIKPVKAVERGRFRLIDIKDVGRRDTAFTWEPKLGKLVRIYEGGLGCKDIMAFHTYAYYGFFKPTLAEVYACINQFVPDWSMVRYFTMLSRDMGPEAILGDYPRPLKPDLVGFKEIEDGILKCVAEHYRLPWPMHMDVKLADNILLATETRDIMGNNAHERWGKVAVPLQEKIEPLFWWQAKEQFLHLFDELRT